MARTYDELVAAGRQAVSQQNWVLGDLALELVPLGQQGVNDDSRDVLAQYAEDIEVKAETLRSYRSVSAAWPEGTRVPSTSWAVHRTFMSIPDRAELIKSRDWTTPAAEAEVKRWKQAKEDAYEIRLRAVDLLGQAKMAVRSAIKELGKHLTVLDIELPGGDDLGSAASLMKQIDAARGELDRCDALINGVASEDLDAELQELLNKKDSDGASTDV